MSILLETFRFYYKYDYEFFPPIDKADCARVNQVILAGKRDSCRHFTTSFCENDVVAPESKSSKRR